MIDAILLYLSAGVLLYLFCVYREIREGFPRFAEADRWSILRGIAGIFIWPLILYWMVRGEV